jgi:hypothetical protein
LSNQIGQWAEVDTFASFDGFDPKGDGEMAFACAWRSQEMDGLMPINKTQ